MHLTIFRMIATSFFLRLLECTKFVFDSLGPRRGAYSTPQAP